MKSTKLCIGYGNKKSICTNQVVDIKKSPYCSNCAGKSFEHQIAKLFRVQGYDVIQDIKLSSTQTDFYAQLKYGILDIGVLVECKWKSNERDCVDSSDVRKFSGSWQIFNNRQTHGHSHKAYIITNARFAPEAIETANELKIELYTEFTLLQNLMNFEPYLKKLITEYDNSHLANHFIDLKTNYDTNLNDEVYSFILDSESEALVLLGDYGSGKTSFCTKLCSDLAYKVLNGQHAPIPILVQLRDYEKSFDMEELITNLLVNRYRIPNGNFSTFLELLQYGYIILIFDGFDEIARRVDYSVKYKVFSEICRFASPLSKVLVTCRRNFFSQREEFERIFKSLPLHYEPNRKNVNFRELEIAELSSSQIKTYIDSYKEKLKSQGFLVEEFYNLISTIHDLRDLAKRPVLLNVIIETIPKLAFEQGTRVNAAMLYDKYTSFWLDREDQKGKTLIKSTEKMIFTTRLSWKMFVRNKLHINYKDLPTEVKEHFNITAVDDIDHFSHDIQNCSFLNNDDKGNYKFIHKSFMEYFVALHILDEIDQIRLSKNVRLLNKLLGSSLITLEVGLFIKDMLESKRYNVPLLIDYFNTFDWNVLSTNAQKNIMCILSKTDVDISTYLDRFQDYEGVDLSCSNISNTSIQQLSFIGSNFYRAKINNVRFLNCNLTNTIFRNSTLNKVKFQQSNIETADFSNSEIISTSFTQSNLTFCKLNNAMLRQCDFDGAELTEIESNSKTKLINCYNLDTTIGLPYTLAY